MNYNTLENIISNPWVIGSIIVAASSANAYYCWKNPAKSKDEDIKLSTKDVAKILENDNKKQEFNKVKAEKKVELDRKWKISDTIFGGFLGAVISGIALSIILAGATISGMSNMDVMPID